MTLEDKVLYHQIHPVKLLVDISTAFIAVGLLWQGSFWLALVIAFVPSLLISALLIRYANLAPYKNSQFGRYVQRNMRELMQATRLGGFLLMVLGGSWRLAWLIVLGLVVIIAAWCSGLFTRSIIRETTEGDRP